MEIWKWDFVEKFILNFSAIFRENITDENYCAFSEFLSRNFEIRSINGKFVYIFWRQILKLDFARKFWILPRIFLALIYRESILGSLSSIFWIFRDKIGILTLMVSLFTIFWREIWKLTFLKLIFWQFLKIGAKIWC